ncbi:TniB family NTP-binding protein [Brunnivagina elsteri]|uniref:TniB family NTP-binding protein n=1 Tax=Brunnivagina elsteri TaxID=1247191 RepID=UPI001FEA90B0|nr:TniB family NTP-binding protein [Calothrix elsteri]
METELGWALEQALKQRKPKIFFIDEAHHLLAVASGRKLTDVPEAIKSLANITHVLHGLIGTYDLLTLHDIGDQLSRRSIYIHLPRYNAEFQEDREIWHSVIWNFQRQIPTREPPDFLSHWEYLYSRSLGCVGILKNWSRNALGEALNENASTVTLKHLENRALSVGQCRNILKHIKQGEARYAEIEGKKEELYQELGLSRPPISRQNYPLQPEIKPQDIEPKKRRKSIGIRKPVRDSIGKENAV